jgi:ribonuclease P protein component
VADEDEPHPRVAYAIGRAVGTAPQRNRLRRRLRHLLADTAEPLPAGLYLVRVAPAARHLSHQELSETVTRLLRTLREAR